MNFPSWLYSLNLQDDAMARVSSLERQLSELQESHHKSEARLRDVTRTLSELEEKKRYADDKLNKSLSNASQQVWGPLLELSLGIWFFFTIWILCQKKVSHSQHFPTIKTVYFTNHNLPNHRSRYHLWMFETIKGCNTNSNFSKHQKNVSRRTLFDARRVRSAPWMRSWATQGVRSLTWSMTGALWM